MTKENLIGQKFGRWKVIDEAPSRNNNHTIYWLCQCECGTIREVRQQGLKSGKSQSCGCYKKDFWTKDISGQKFGRLTAISKTNKTSKDHYVIWLCQCECGNTCEVDLHSLQRGNTQSCGCLQKERMFEKNSQRRKDLLNKRFGKLTVIEDDGSKDGHHYWKCLCECGKEISVRAEYLYSGHKNSCGCLKQSLGEYNIECLLKLNNIKYITEYNPNINKFFDFAILNDNDEIIRLIEFDGIQHYQEIEFFNKHNLVQTQEADLLKNEYAINHNIPLVRIPYWERDNITMEIIMGDKYLVK